MVPDNMNPMTFTLPRQQRTAQIRPISGIARTPHDGANGLEQMTSGWARPFRAYLVPVFGMLTILLVGSLIALCSFRRAG